MDESTAAAVFDPDIEELFGPTSPFAAVLSGFAPRKGQAEMAQAVAQSIEDGENLVVEAGTGTGKTLAYLVPALRSDRRVIISTGTKPLQDQLYHRDLPMLCSVLGRPAKIAQLKGRSNYLCQHRLSLAAQGPAGRKSGGDFRLIQQWGQRTTRGDKAELGAVAEDSPIWGNVTSTVDNCLGSNCDFYSTCHVVTARQDALAAEIVVVNHHLLLADLLLKEEGFGQLLPGSDAVIIDEAHQFPDIAQGFFNEVLTSRSLLDLAADVRNEALVVEKLGSGEAGKLVERLTQGVREIRAVLPRESGGAFWNAVVDRLEPKLQQLVEILDDYIEWLDGQDEGLVGLRRCRERCQLLFDRLERIANADETAGMRWAGTSGQGFSLNYTPLELAGSLQSLLEAQQCAWIFTSATLAVGTDFSHFLMRVGLRDTRTMAIPSPFDYERNGLLYLPENMPEPNSPAYTRVMLETLMPLLKASDGRAFLLFTSHRAVTEAAKLLRDDAEFDWPLLVQGEAPRSRLLDDFSRLPKPVLLGTSSFWEGVDMRGDQLVLVAIDKLPFASPGDPLLKVRLEGIRQRGGNPFGEYQLPQAVLTLKQGVGRLIRDYTDRGVVVVCDPRIHSKSYGSAFLKSLPPFARTRDSLAAREFLSENR